MSHAALSDEQVEAYEAYVDTIQLSSGEGSNCISYIPFSGFETTSIDCVQTLVCLLREIQTPLLAKLDLRWLDPPIDTAHIK